MSDKALVNLNRERVTTLLLINASLIKKASSLYVSILSNQQALQLLPPQNRQNLLQQYNNISRRLQCNLSVLSYIYDSYHNRAAAHQGNRLQFPIILSAPNEMPELRMLYKRLQDLYPDAIQFVRNKIQEMKQNQDPTVAQAMLAGGGQVSSNPMAVSPMVQSLSNKQQLPQNANPYSQYGQAPNQTQSFGPPRSTAQQNNVMSVAQGNARQPQPMKNQRVGGLQQAQMPRASSFQDLQFAQGISPQMMTKEQDFGTDNNMSPLNIFPNDKFQPNLLSISPLQIIQQPGNGANDFSMELF